MRRPEFIARQASCPTGLLGRLLARIMATETLAANDRTLELLVHSARNTERVCNKRRPDIRESYSLLPK